MQDVEGRTISYRCASQLEVVINVGCVCLVLLLQAMSCSFSILCLHFLAVNLMTGVCMVDVMQFCSCSPSFAPAGGKEVILISKSRISLSSLSFHPVCSRWQKHTLLPPQPPTSVTKRRISFPLLFHLDSCRRQGCATGASNNTGNCRLGVWCSQLQEKLAVLQVRQACKLGRLLALS